MLRGKASLLSPAWRSGRSPGGLAEAPPGPGRAIWQSGLRRRQRPDTEADAIARGDRTRA